MNRTLVIGDIHGGLRALVQVLERAGVTKSDHLIFLGDYVDGWSDSARLIEFLIQFSSMHTCIFIKGNHDAWCEDWLANEKADRSWILNGGRSTVESYALVTKEDKKKHLQFFQHLKMFEIDYMNRLFVHAGFTSMQGPVAEIYSTNFIWDRTLWEMAITMDKDLLPDSPLYPKRLKLFREIYIGHTPTLYFNHAEPMQGGNVWNIDTGSAFTGKLTIMDIDTKVFWQSDRVLDLYPGETGRNRS